MNIPNGDGGEDAGAKPVENPDRVNKQLSKATCEMKKAQDPNKRTKMEKISDSKIFGSKRTPIQTEKKRPAQRKTTAISTAPNNQTNNRQRRTLTKPTTTLE